MVNSMDSLAPVSSSTLADQVYTRLRTAVQDGSLRPGEKITERDLAARLQVSPTPVREALRQLIHERVVERAGTRALRIADYDPVTMDEIAETEARLAGLAARFAARKRTDALVAELAADLAKSDPLVARLECGPTRSSPGSNAATGPTRTSPGYLRSCAGSTGGSRAPHATR
jgi:DNA-binding GntR family transcriptional regulator